MDKIKHNGWSNYATWRVNLEIFSDDERFTDEWIEREGEEYAHADVSSLADELKDIAETYIENMECESEIVKGWANAFVNEVNFYEIAETMASDNPKLIRKNDKAD